MGTKNNPASFDCYANAEPDEPMFVLLARDERAPGVVRTWVARHAGPLRAAYGPWTEKEQEALDCADAMEAWRKANRG